MKCIELLTSKLLLSKSFPGLLHIPKAGELVFPQPSRPLSSCIRMSVSTFPWESHPFPAFSATSQSLQAGPTSRERNHCSHLWFCIQMGLTLVPCCNCLEIFHHKIFYAKYKTSKCIQKVFPFFLKHSVSWF